MKKIYSIIEMYYHTPTWQFQMNQTAIKPCVHIISTQHSSKIAQQTKYLFYYNSGHTSL